MSATPSRGRRSIDDEQLVALARAVPEPVLSEARREEMRTAFLSSVRGLRSGSRALAAVRKRRRLVLLGTMILAGASAAAAWRIGLVGSTERPAPTPQVVAARDMSRPAPVERPAVEAPTPDSAPARPASAARPHKLSLLGHHDAARKESGSDLESAFARGWSALGAGDFSSAAEAFQRAAVDKDNALAEDAVFWRGVALDRAGRYGAAREALLGFLARYPDSGRRGEASVILGWLLVRAGELQEARGRFEAAVQDPTERVRNSARTGLAAASPAEVAR